jgi:ABC-type molybdate transport system ATPase subunit
MDSYTKEHKKEIQNILNHIEVPTLFVSSSKDELVPLKHMKDMVSMMNKTEIVHLEKAHHEVFHEQSKEANVNIFNFLQKHHLTDNVNLATALTVVFAAVGLALLSTPEALQSLGSATITGAAVTLENVNVTSHLSVLGVKVIAIATLLSGFLYIRNKYQ